MRPYKDGESDRSQTTVGSTRLLLTNPACDARSRLPKYYAISVCQLSRSRRHSTFQLFTPSDHEARLIFKLRSSRTKVTFRMAISETQTTLMTCEAGIAHELPSLYPYESPSAEC